MGHVVNPISYRLYNIRFWNSSWFNNKNFSLILNKDFYIYKYITKFFKYDQRYFFSHILLTRFFGILKIDLFLYDYKIIDSFDRLKRKLKFNFYRLGKKKFIIRLNNEQNLDFNKFKLISLKRLFSKSFNFNKVNLFNLFYIINITRYFYMFNLFFNSKFLNYQRYYSFNSSIKYNIYKYKNLFKNLINFKKLKKNIAFIIKNNLLVKNLNLNLDNKYYFLKKKQKIKFKLKKKKSYIVNLRKLSYRWNLVNFINKNKFIFNIKSNSYYYDYLLNSQEILYKSFKLRIDYFFKLYNIDKRGYKVRRWKRKFLKKKKNRNYLKKKYFKIFKKKKRFFKRNTYNIKRYFWRKLNKNFYLTKVLFFKRKKFYNLWYKNNIITVNFYKKNSFSYFLFKHKFKLYPLNLKKKINLKIFFENLSNFGNKIDLVNYRLNKKYGNLLKYYNNLPFNSIFHKLNLEKKFYNFSKKNYKYKIYNYKKFNFILNRNFHKKNLLNSRLNLTNFNNYYNWSNLFKLKSKAINILKNGKLKNYRGLKKKNFKLKNSLFILQKYLNYRKNFLINNFILKQVSIISLLKSISIKKILYLILVLKKSFNYFNSNLSILKNSYFYFLFLNLNRILLKKKVNILKKVHLKFQFFKKLNIKLLITNIKLKYSNFFFYFFYKVYFLKTKKKRLNLKKNYFFFERIKKHELIILYKQLIKIEDNNIKLNFNIIREPTASMVNFYLKKNIKKHSSLNQVIYPILRSIVYLYKNIIGIQINVSGKFTKKRRKSYLWYRFGNVKIGSQSSLIDFSTDFVILRFGVGGTKVWLYYKKPLKMLLQSSY